MCHSFTSKMFLCNLVAQIIFAVLISACLFDDAVLKPLHIPKVYVDYRHSRLKRDVNHYFPMRINVDLRGLAEEDAKRIGPTLKAVVSTISHIFHVIPVNGPLLLERQSCGSTWSHGPNKGSCSSLRSKFKGEFCENKIDNFQIPEGHLDELNVYDFANSSPVHTLPAGRGADATDFILYVTSHLSSWCLQEGIKAYSSYCRLDQYGRPIAGFINFCPETIDKLLFNRVEDFKKVVFHEMFHILGFSKDLFPLFSGCPIGELYCQKPKYFIQKDSYNVPRLRFSNVVQEARNHFGCESPEFGAPLELVNGFYTSHWDPLLMYGSVMAPYLHELGFAMIDPITLSAFSDSGWYHVNFSYAKPYAWGKGEGCEFGLSGECDSRAELCKINSDSTVNDSDVGCDFMHFTQTVCQKLQPNHHCGLYKPNVKNDCRQQYLKIDGKRMRDLRCFVIEKDNKFSTTCSAFFCKTNKEFSVLMNDTWVTCPFSTAVKFDDVSLICPKADVFCHQAELQSDASSADKTSSSITMMITLTVIAVVWVMVCGMVVGLSVFHFMGKTCTQIHRSVR